MVATVLQQAIFLIAANVVDRPRPPVAQLDVAPQAASYPSGHVGASTTLYLTFALLALQVRTAWLTCALLTYWWYRSSTREASGPSSAGGITPADPASGDPGRPLPRVAS